MTDSLCHLGEEGSCQAKLLECFMSQSLASALKTEITTAVRAEIAKEVSALKAEVRALKKSVTGRAPARRSASKQPKAPTAKERRRSRWYFRKSKARTTSRWFKHIVTFANWMERVGNRMTAAAVRSY